MMKEYTPKQAALLLLNYLHTKESWSTFTDDFSAFMRQHGVEWERTEFLLYHMENEGLIRYLGKDRYWIQMTRKGNQFRKTRGLTSAGNMKLIGILATIISLLAAIIKITMIWIG